MDRCLKDKAHFIIAQTIWNNKNGKAVFAEQVFDRCQKKFQDEINRELYKLIEQGGGGGTGKDGKTPVLKAGDVTSIPYGSEPTFKLVYEEDNTEGNPVYRMDLGIPQGKPGEDGDDGDDGISPTLRLTEQGIEVSYDKGGTWNLLVPISEFHVTNNITNEYVNNPDEEDITVIDNKLKFADKEYNLSEFSGLGRVYLRKNIVNGKNILAYNAFNSSSTIYHIQYDYDLDGRTVVVPNNCVLLFEGGNLTNGKLVGNKTSYITKELDVECENIINIKYKDIFDSLSLDNIDFDNNNIYIKANKALNINPKHNVLDFKDIVININNDDNTNKRIIVNSNNIDSISICNLNIKGDSIKDSQGKYYNTDNGRSCLYLENFNRINIYNVNISNVRGDAILFMNCDNTVISNVHITYFTYCAIRGEYLNIIISNSYIKGLVDDDNNVINEGLGAGISVNKGTKCIVSNNIITNIHDTGIQINGFLQAEAIGNIVDTFGKDGIKIMCSPVYLNGGYVERGIISNNIIKNKFEGKVTGSSYIVVSNCLNGIIANNATIKGTNEKDGSYDFWYSVSYTIDNEDTLIDNRIQIFNNKLHNNILVRGCKNVTIDNNNFDGYIGGYFLHEDWELFITNNTSGINACSYSFLVIENTNNKGRCYVNHNNITFSDNKRIVLPNCEIIELIDNIFKNVSSSVIAFNAGNIDKFIFNNNTIFKTITDNAVLIYNYATINKVEVNNNTINKATDLNTPLSSIISNYANIGYLICKNNICNKILIFNVINLVSYVGQYSNVSTYPANGKLYEIINVYPNILCYYNGTNWIDLHGDFAGLIRVGNSSNRPENPNLGFQFWDNTVKKPIWWNGTEWITYPDSGGGGGGADGKTPVMQIGNVTTVDAGEAATANVRQDGTDVSGNPIYKIDFGIPRGSNGTNGNDGIDGKTPVFETGTITTLAPDQPATCTITKTGDDPQGNPIYRVDVGIPKGDTGAPGDTPSLDGYATETWVTTQINNTVGIINASLDNINGEIV
jgi:hypothetical protein